MQAALHFMSSVQVPNGPRVKKDESLSHIQKPFRNDPSYPILVYIDNY